jgi:putative membrane-bound dehydrogenase-like protein
MKHLHFLPVLLTLIVFSCEEPLYTDPIPPEQALQSFQLQEGFRIELFAAEPHVFDPVCMVFDERGDVYVVEMPDYPYKPEPDRAEGRIRRLVDRDGDGRIDTSTVFADRLSEATSILPWEGGLLVTAAPHILYLKDTDGDYRADLHEVLFSGFFENNSEAQITNLQFGIDNWIYAANFGQPGEVTFKRQPNAPPLSMRGGDFRFRLDRKLFELETGPTQFGLALNDWGHRFMAQNTIHIRHAVIPWRYLHRHPYLPSTKADPNISDHDLEMFQLTPPPYWRAERTQRRQKSYDEQNLDRIEYAEDHFTGASGTTFYDGDAFPPEFYGHIFTGDVAGNLVHRDILSPLEDSPTYVAQRAPNEQDREFLASADPWFRPANFTVGPDGYLYVIDMYRQHIETPVSIPEDLKAKMDFYNGVRRGRIYRIVPVESPPRAKTFPILSNKPSLEYVDLLAHPNRWHRLQAQRLLLERQDASIEPELRALFAGHEDPRARLHALYTLEGLKLLDAGLVRSALADPHPGLREHGAILAERFPELLPMLIEQVDDPNVQAVFQATLSLGEFAAEEVVSALTRVVEKWGADRWFRTAVLSSKAGSSPELVEQLAGLGYFTGEATQDKTAFLKDFAYVIGARNLEGQAEDFLEILASLDESWQAVGLNGLGEGLKKVDAKLATNAHLEELFQNLGSNVPEELKTRIEELR